MSATKRLVVAFVVAFAVAFAVAARVEIVRALAVPVASFLSFVRLVEARGEIRARRLGRAVPRRGILRRPRARFSRARQTSAFGVGRVPFLLGEPRRFPRQAATRAPTRPDARAEPAGSVRRENLLPEPIEYARDAERRRFARRPGG